MNYEVVFELNAEALHQLEAKVKALRNYIGQHGGDAAEEEKRLADIERILVRLFGSVGD